MRKRWYLLDEEELIRRIEITTVKTVNDIVHTSRDDEHVPISVRYSMICGAVDLMEELKNSIINAKVEDGLENAQGA